MDCLLTILLEPILYAYFDLVEQILDGKQLKKGLKYFLMILCFCVSLCAFLSILIGMFWVMDSQPFKTYGTVLLIAGTSVLALHVFLAVFARVANGEETEEMDETDNLNEKNEEMYSVEIEEPTPIVCYLDEKDGENGSRPVA